MRPPGVEQNRDEGHTHEKIIRIRHITANAEKLHQVVKLAVDVAAYLPHARKIRTPSGSALSRSHSRTSRIAYCYRRIDRDHIPLLDEQLPRLVAELADLGFGYRAARAQLGDGPGRQHLRISISVPSCLGR